MVFLGILKAYFGPNAPSWRFGVWIYRQKQTHDPKDPRQRIRAINGIDTFWRSPNRLGFTFRDPLLKGGTNIDSLLGASYQIPPKGKFGKIIFPQKCRLSVGDMLMWSFSGGYTSPSQLTSRKWPSKVHKIYGTWDIQDIASPFQEQKVTMQCRAVAVCKAAALGLALGRNLFKLCFHVCWGLNSHCFHIITCNRGLSSTQ